MLSATLLVCGFAGTALLAPQGIWALYLCYGVLIGCGTGLGYNVAIATVTLWFPDRTGFASGVMFMGFGLGSLTLGTPANTIIATAGLAIALTVVAITRRRRHDVPGAASEACSPTTSASCWAWRRRRRP